MFQKKYEKKSDIIEKISVDIKVFSRNLTFFRKSIMLTKIYTYERRRKIYSKIQKQIASKFGNDETFAKHWEDWRWHIKHTIRDIETFERITGIVFDDEFRRDVSLTLDKFPLAITPYYLSLIDREDYRNDPVFIQSFPVPQELEVDPREMADPLDEDKDSPVPGITHRYPDRVLFHISNLCAMYCRHCTRKRKVGDQDSIPGREAIMQGIEYIANTPQVRDVLLSGGDPLMLSDDYLDWILTELCRIPHVEVVRIGTRIPVVLPYRITDKLVAMLRKHQPLWINTHFNHPREMTSSSKRALRKLADAGFPLGNQTVLLAGVNDCPRIIKELVHRLVENRVRPYYLYQCDLSEGLTHFRTPVGKGIEIMEGLIGHTSGFSIPTYVIDAPGGGGKIPLNPNYLISLSTNKVVLRNYEGVITTYQEPNSYEPIFCDRQCAECHLQLKLKGADECQATGIVKLLADHDDTISLTPEDNERMVRRGDD
jgi:lysine 2,3-aminomutase